MRGTWGAPISASLICVLTRFSAATGAPASGAGAGTSTAGGAKTGPGATLKGLLPADTALLLGGSAVQGTRQGLGYCNVLPNEGSESYRIE